MNSNATGPVVLARRLAAAAGASLSLAAFANPTGPAVLSGQVTFEQHGNVLTVTATPGAIINWQSFSIGANDVVNFVTPGTGPAVQLRIVGGDPSVIAGTLQTNANVVLTAPGGLVVTAGGSVDVAGLTVTTNAHAGSSPALGADFISIDGAVRATGSLSLTGTHILVNGLLDAAEITITASEGVTLNGSVQPSAPVAIGVDSPLLSNGTGGQLAITHVNAPNSGSIHLASGSVSFAPGLEGGWNLLGNSLDVAIDVAATLGAPGAAVPGVTENAIAVWKWNSGSSRWAFYSPHLDANANAAYAAAHGFDVLATIGPREGFWMQARDPFVLPPVVGATAAFGAAEFSALPPGFSLIAIDGPKTPTQFNMSIAQSSGLLSLWGWDAGQQRWYFYSPLLESMGGLTAVKAHAEARGWLHFADRNRTLGVGVGFWVHRP